jgi:hypothetical protein
MNGFATILLTNYDSLKLFIHSGLAGSLLVFEVGRFSRWLVFHSMSMTLNSGESFAPRRHNAHAPGA